MRKVGGTTIVIAIRKIPLYKERKEKKTEIPLYSIKNKQNGYVRDKIVYGGVWNENKIRINIEYHQTVYENKKCTSDEKQRIKSVFPRLHGEINIGNDRRYRLEKISIVSIRSRFEEKKTKYLLSKKHCSPREGVEKSGTLALSAPISLNS